MFTPRSSPKPSPMSGSSAASPQSPASATPRIVQLNRSSTIIRSVASPSSLFPEKLSPSPSPSPSTACPAASYSFQSPASGARPSPAAFSAPASLSPFSSPASSLSSSSSSLASSPSMPRQSSLTNTRQSPQFGSSSLVHSLSKLRPELSFFQSLVDTVLYYFKHGEYRIRQSQICQGRGSGPYVNSRRLNVKLSDYLEDAESQGLIISGSDDPNNPNLRWVALKTKYNIHLLGEALNLFYDYAASPVSSEVKKRYEAAANSTISDEEWESVLTEAKQLGFIVVNFNRDNREKEIYPPSTGVFDGSISAIQTMPSIKKRRYSISDALAGSMPSPEQRQPQMTRLSLQDWRSLFDFLSDLWANSKEKELIVAGNFRGTPLVTEIMRHRERASEGLRAMTKQKLHHLIRASVERGWLKLLIPSELNTDDSKSVEKLKELKRKVEEILRERRWPDEMAVEGDNESLLQVSETNRVSTRLLNQVINATSSATNWSFECDFYQVITATEMKDRLKTLVRENTAEGLSGASRELITCPSSAYRLDADPEQEFFMGSSPYASAAQITVAKAVLTSDESSSSSSNSSSSSSSFPFSTAIWNSVVMPTLSAHAEEIDPDVAMKMKPRLRSRISKIAAEAVDPRSRARAGPSLKSVAVSAASPPMAQSPSVSEGHAQCLSAASASSSRLRPNVQRTAQTLLPSLRPLASPSAFMMQIEQQLQTKEAFLPTPPSLFHSDSDMNAQPNMSAHAAIKTETEMGVRDEPMEASTTAVINLKQELMSPETMEAEEVDSFLASTLQAPAVVQQQSRRLSVFSKMTEGASERENNSE